MNSLKTCLPPTECTSSHSEKVETSLKTAAHFNYVSPPVYERPGHTTRLSYRWVAVLFTLHHFLWSNQDCRSHCATQHNHNSSAHQTSRNSRKPRHKKATVKERQGKLHNALQRQLEVNKCFCNHNMQLPAGVVAQQGRQSYSYWKLVFTSL